MNKSNDIAGEVVNEQINRMMEQYRGELESSLQDFWKVYPFINKDDVFEIALRSAIMAKISVLAVLN